MKRNSYLVNVCKIVSAFVLALLPVRVPVVTAQDTVTGAFEGTVTSSQTGEPISGATTLIINQQTGLVITKITDSRGRFYQGLLNPGIYTIRVSAQGFETREIVQRLFVTRTGEVVPVPVVLDPVSGVAAPTATPTLQAVEDTDIRAKINARDARRDGSFTEEEISTLPLGATTLVRTFDELALLLPGVAPPPQTLGGVAGPGVGAGVGSAGQFAVNGLRSRANNFTVDGSDNNDEDIGVRRQGFLALIPQPIESVKEYQVITLLAPAQFGRNIGAQVNAVSKSGGNETHGTFYGIFNSSQLNARNFFDTTFGNARFALRAGDDQEVLLDGQPLTVRNESGGKDSFTLGQGGFVLGGPLEPSRGPDRPGRMFYFISAEGQILNATQEASFAVPTVEGRGFFDSGATGLFIPPGIFNTRDTGALAFPTTEDGDAIFGLFPFPNNPQGVYGANTFTQVLPASGQGKILSGKFDGNFVVRGRQQSVTGRYNFTDDFRNIPRTGGAIFSTLTPRVRTQNFSFFYNSELSGPNSAKPIFNQLRLSYGRTRLNFQEARDQTFALPSAIPNVPFLLNTPYIQNVTLPDDVETPNTGPVNYVSTGFGTEDVLGPVGQVFVAGFSPVGVDVFNFPQRRVNNTYQFADDLTVRYGNHSFAFGTDNRRSELNSELPRNSRPLITFYGEPEIDFTGDEPVFTGRFFRPVDLAAAGAATGFFQTLATTDSDTANLRFYQFNFFGQDTWRVRPSLTLSYGLRYEYNTPPRETNRRIENTFDDPALDAVPGLRDFIEGRTRIFEPERNNFAPRVGIAYSPNLFGRERATVIRGGYGLFYDQILGAVVSQSRNVYPNFLTVNFAGGGANANAALGELPELNLLNPSAPIVVPVDGELFIVELVQNGTLNRAVSGVTTTDLVNFINVIVTGEENPSSSVFGATLPARRLATPMAHHYNLTLEQQLNRNLVVSAAYVGTLGRKLLRFTTPNLGLNAVVVPFDFDVITEDELEGGGAFDRVGQPRFYGLAFPAGFGRPVSTVGSISRFETTANSRYDSLQLQARGRLRRSLQFQAAYTLSKSIDDVSDVFDLAGAPALPQNSLTLDERGPSNFDVRHRFTYNFIYDFPTLRDRSRVFRLLFGGLQVAGTGRYQTAQPFTVNTYIDVNLDGNITDRLNTTDGLLQTGDRRQPLRLTTDDLSLLRAPVGSDGQIGRNTFRAGDTLELDLAVSKRFALSERQNLILRADIFNFINRANFGIPERILESPGFGSATETATPGRRIQFALKYSF